MSRKDPNSPEQPTDSSSGSTSVHRRNRIVVGSSTSISSRNAVVWAAAEAERYRAGLHIVHAYPLPQLGQPMQHDVDDLLRNEASVLLDRIADNARRDHPNLDITTRLIHGAPVNALRDESVDATLTVVGAKESGRLAGAILGSIASAIAAVNPAPVAVIHPDHQANGRGPVVVGIDGSGGNSAAIKFAFAEASVRNTGLSAVYAWNESVIEGSLHDNPSLLDPAAIEQEETAALSETLAGWCEMYPDVVVAHEVRRGRPASVLQEFTASASVMVVGRRSRGEFEALVMGSTSRSLMAHSSCPVVIVRSVHTDHPDRRIGALLPIR